MFQCYQTIVRFCGFCYNTYRKIPREQPKIYWKGGRRMLTIERQAEILRLLKDKKSVTVVELGKLFNVGEATIRRDLEKLERQGFLERTYGGAVLLDSLNAEIHLAIREQEQKEEKDFIGQTAAAMIQDGDTVILDSSTTTATMITHLSDKKNLTVITNGAKTAVELAGMNIAIHSTGGMLRENSLSFIGDHAKDFLKSYFVDKAFFSCRAVSMERGLTDSNQFEAELRKVMIHNCKQAFLLADHTKFGKVSFAHIANFEKIYMVITDKLPSSDWMKFFQDLHVELRFAENLTEHVVSRYS